MFYWTGAHNQQQRADSSSSSNNSRHSQEYEQLWKHVCSSLIRFFRSFISECVLARSEWSPKRSTYTYAVHVYMYGVRVEWVSEWNAMCLMCVGMRIDMYVCSVCLSCKRTKRHKRTSIVCDYIFYERPAKKLYLTMKIKTIYISIAEWVYCIALGFCCRTHAQFSLCFFGWLVPLRIEWMTVKKDQQNIWWFINCRFECHHSKPLRFTWHIVLYISVRLSMEYCLWNNNNNFYEF